MFNLIEYLVIVAILPTKVLGPSDELSLTLEHQNIGFPGVPLECYPPRYTSALPAGS